MCETTKEVEITIRVRVPVEAKFVAVDKIGEVWWYTGRPLDSDDEFATEPTGNDCAAVDVTNWRETLTEV